MAYPMIAVILISRRESEYFDLNQKDLRRAAVKSGGIVQILRELFALLFANHAAKNSVAVAKSSAMPPTRRFVKTDEATREGGANRADRYCAFCNSGCVRSRF